MKIVIAPDSFKESLSALDVAEQIEAGFRDIFPNAYYFKQPVADGGEGTVETMVAATQGEIVHVPVIGPLGTDVMAFLGFSKDKKCAFIEMAAASGLELVASEQRDPLITTSYGTGQLIQYAINQGVERCIIGIGGSATNDGGAGMMQALGAKLLDADHNQIGYGGGALANLAYIDVSGIDQRVLQCRFDIACDVTNPLLGVNGASNVFGPQKGATPQIIEQLEKNLTHYASIIERDLNVDVKTIPGSGAAGGMGAAFNAFLKAELKPGFEIISDLLNLPKLFKDADLVITGEGRLDCQSVNGKVPVGISNLAKKLNKPVIVIAGSLGDNSQIFRAYGINSAFSVLNKVTTLSDALLMAKDNVYLCAKNVAATLQVGMELVDNIEVNNKL